MIDYLVMLLSTDWFSPFWVEIGINLDISPKAILQAGCRVIVHSFMDDAEEYYQIDFSGKRKQETNFKFSELIEGVDGNVDLVEVAKQWDEGFRDEVNTSLFLRALAHDALDTTRAETGFPLAVESWKVVVEDTVLHDQRHAGFRDISAESHSDWDTHVRKLFVETPWALPDKAQFAVAEYSLRTLWEAVCRRYTLQQRQELIAWYKQRAAKAGVLGNPLPFYIS